ncbi:Hemolymph lipopolysaccharide-binding protein [Blattella germanica]|nr:Hemolymph lipopolysaccharide-binding protein [Blattella germanica]
MEHDEDPGPLEMKLDHKIIKCAERNRVLMVATITGPAPETDYELIPGHGLYKIHNGKMNWYKALKTCKREDAHLVILNSEEELTKLKFLGKIEGDFYTSINDLEKEGHFVTQFGDTLNSTGFMKWIPGEPNNGFSGNCVRVLPTLGKIADGDCNSNFAFICEKPIS